MDRGTYPARGGRKSTHPTSRDRWGHGRKKAEAGGDPYLTGRGHGAYIQQAETEGDMNSTGRDRWGPNRQKQMGADIQQVETDGDTYSTGRDRRGHNPTGTQHVTCTQQVKTGTHQVETGTDKTGRWAAERQSRSARPTGTDRDADLTHRKPDPGLKGRAPGSCWSAAGGWWGEDWGKS